jgi:hypothetical protein
MRSRRTLVAAAALALLLMSVGLIAKDAGNVTTSAPTVAISVNQRDGLHCDRGLERFGADHWQANRNSQRPTPFNLFVDVHRSWRKRQCDSQGERG